MKTIINNFLRGLLFVFPLAATAYIIWAAVLWSNNVFNHLLFQWLNIDIPGLGILTVLVGVTLIGFLFSSAFIKPIFAYFDRFLASVPIVKIIYTSVRELTEAFVGDKKRFNKPVIADFNFNGECAIKRVGFITQDDLSELGLKGMVTVYCPHSYTFSGNLFILPKEAVAPLPLNATEVMKFTVSAGVTKLDV